MNAKTDVITIGSSKSSPETSLSEEYDQLPQLTFAFNSVVQNSLAPVTLGYAVFHFF